VPSPVFNGLGAKINTLLKDAKPATFNPKSGSSQTIDVIFNDKHQEIDKDGKPYGAPRPVAWVLKSSGLSFEFDDQLEINGTDYLIKEFKDDGLEMYELILVEI
jgi:hypothetical protein